MIDEKEKQILNQLKELETIVQNQNDHAYYNDEEILQVIHNIRHLVTDQEN